MKIFNRFFFKLIFLLIILNGILISDMYNVFELDTFKNKMYENINFLKINDLLIGDILLKKDDTYHEVNSNITIIEKENKKALVLDEEDVYPISRGQIIKIIKEESGLYKVYIQTLDSIYVYSSIYDINVNIYQIVSIEDVIGKTKLFDESFYCFIDILEDDSIFEEN